MMQADLNANANTTQVNVTEVRPSLKTMREIKQNESDFDRLQQQYDQLVAKLEPIKTQHKELLGKLYQQEQEKLNTHKYINQLIAEKSELMNKLSATQAELNVYKYKETNTSSRTVTPLQNYMAPSVSVKPQFSYDEEKYSNYQTQIDFLRREVERLQKENEKLVQQNIKLNGDLKKTFQITNGLDRIQLHDRLVAVQSENQELQKKLK